MKIEQQVVNLEIAKKLKELGVIQKSFVSWTDYPTTIKIITNSSKLHNKKNVYSAFTVAELGEMLPDWTRIKKFEQEDASYLWYGFSKEWHTNPIIKECNTEADARGKMLIYLIENKLIEVNNAKEKE